VANNSHHETALAYYVNLEIILEGTLFLCVALSTLAVRFHNRWHYFIHFALLFSLSGFIIVAVRTNMNFGMMKMEHYAAHVRWGQLAHEVETIFEYAQVPHPRRTMRHVRLRHDDLLDGDPLIPSGVIQKSLDNLKKLPVRELWPGKAELLEFQLMKASEFTEFASGQVSETGVAF
jgi:hypothetical protein